MTLLVLVVDDEPDVEVNILDYDNDQNAQPPAQGVYPHQVY